MENNFEKSEWIINIKGYFEEITKDSYSGEKFTDLVYGIKSINYIGTKEELNIYIDSITGTKSQLKVIGLQNKADTLVEFRRIFDVFEIETSDIAICDVFEKKTWIFDSSVAFNILPKEERTKFIESLKDNPIRKFIRKDYLKEFVFENLKSN